MVFEVIAPEEGQVAQVALVRPLARVVADMAVSVGPGREALLAVLTQVSFVDVHGVVLQLLECPERLSANIAAMSATNGASDLSLFSFQCPKAEIQGVACILVLFFQRLGFDNSWNVTSQSCFQV